ncbi:hypothetical protein WN944_003082 [Citrus x changshan-huyou]|uniref:Uncharacterized protein n=1 Tax=Citrus x changshan-huyou TaxID=2935761 RepID=A0AAP0LXT4_9ROSI
MEKRNGSVRNVQRNMQFNLTGKLTPRLVAPASISVIVALYFPVLKFRFEAAATTDEASLVLSSAKASQKALCNRYNHKRIKNAITMEEDQIHLIVSNPGWPGIIGLRGYLQLY